MEFWFRFGIVVTDTGGYASYLNGKVEHPNLTIANGVRALLRNANQDDDKWCFAAQSYPDSYNLTLHSALNKSPHEDWYGKKGHIETLRVWGSSLFPVDYELKLDDRVKDAKFMGFGNSSRIVQYIDPKMKRIKSTPNAYSMNTPPAGMMVN